MRYMVERNYVRVIGPIWQPGFDSCAMEYQLSDAALKEIGEFTRDNVARWLKSHAGDFQSITDFYATAGDKEIPWATEEGEEAYANATEGNG